MIVFIVFYSKKPFNIPQMGDTQHRMDPIQYLSAAVTATKQKDLESDKTLVLATESFQRRFPSGNLYKPPRGGFFLIKFRRCGNTRIGLLL